MWLLSVNDSQRASRYELEVTNTEGENVILMCNVSEIPSPMMSWMKPNGQPHSWYMLNVNGSETC